MYLFQYMYVIKLGLEFVLPVVKMGKTSVCINKTKI